MIKISKQLIALFCLCSFYQSIMAMPDKKRDDQNNGAFSGGVVYSLPKTGVKITVEAEQDIFFHGPYSQYAKTLLGVDNASSSDSERWQITNVSMSAYGEPDEKRVYKTLGPISSSVSLSESGVLVGINSENNASGCANEQGIADFTDKIVLPKEIWPDLSMHPFYVDDDTTVASGVRLLTEKEKAQEAAHTITKLRKRRFHMMSANYDVLPPDGEAYKVSLKELDHIEKEYTGLFIGKSFRQKRTFTFYVVPDTKGQVAFRFSETEGVLPSNDLSGKPIMLEVTSSGALARQGAAVASGSSASSGVNYCLPENGVVRLTNSGRVLAQKRMPFAQLGTVVSIPDDLLDGNYHIKLYDTTGAIKEIIKE